jgi:hypothetical protein
LILSILLETEGKEDTDLTVKVLKKCEEYIFKVFALSGRQSNTGDSHFYRKAKEYFDEKLTKRDVLADIDDWIDNHFRIQSFVELIDELFDNGGGYYDWNYIDYFLFEYDLFLKESSRGNAGKAIDWREYTEYKKDYVSIEHIYPFNDEKDCWKNIFGKYKKERKDAMKNSLGNLLPLSTQRNSSFQNNCFQEKKDDGKGGGYCVGSFSEAEIYKQKEWNSDKILERGIKLLEFMEVRWKISVDDKKSILHLKF